MSDICTTSTEPHLDHCSPDADLVVAARDGRRRAAELLFERHRRAAAAVARRRLHDQAMVDDAVAEAFVRTFERLSSLRQPDRFRAFLLTVVRSVAADELRQVRRAVPDAELDRCPAPGGVEAEVEGGDDALRLLLAVASLPARQRYAVRRFYWDEVRVARLAEELGVSVNATTQLLFRARAGLAARTGASCRRPSRR